MSWPNGTRLKTFASGGSFLPGDANNIEDRMLQIAGHRGKSIIAAEESRTGATYGLMTTPDRVSGIVVPTDGLLFVAYSALWKSTAAAAGRAAIFIGANQLKFAVENGPPTVTDNSAFTGQPNFYGPLSSSPNAGLVAEDSTIGNSSNVTTGQLVTAGLSFGDAIGGIAAIFVAAGTYDVSVQFRATSGSVTAKERKLWVWTDAFA